MVYFDLFDSLKEYNHQEIGELFLAMLEYAMTGVLPDFNDRGMRTLWKSIQPKIDRDNERYQKTVEARQYAAYCRECKKMGTDALSQEEWKHQMISNDDFHIQLQKSSSTTSSTTSSTATGSVRGDARGDTKSESEILQEEYEKAKERNDINAMVAINIRRQRGF